MKWSQSHWPSPTAVTKALDLHILKNTRAAVGAVTQEADGSRRQPRNCIFPPLRPTRLVCIQTSESLPTSTDLFTDSDRSAAAAESGKTQQGKAVVSGSWLLEIETVE